MPQTDNGIRLNGAQLNGEVATREDLLALGLINYGHFTTMRVDDGRIRGLSDHCDRLVRDCRRLFDTDLDPDRVRRYLRQAIRDLDGSLLIRVTVYDPAADLIHPDGEPAILITTRPAGPVPAPPLRVKTIMGGRDLPEVKHVGLFGPLWHRREARRGGYDDALLINPDGTIIEGTTWNVGFIIDDQLVWPKGDALPGVIMGLLRKAHPESEVRTVSLSDLPSLTAAFATSSGIGVRAISTIDRYDYPPDHPLPNRLLESYLKLPLEAP